HDAAPDAFIQMNEDDAARLGIAEGDMVEVETRRGKVLAPARLGDIIPGHVFLPFHYGYWDRPDRPRAANELTLPSWHPASKQPQFKYAAARASKVGVGEKVGGAVVSKVVSAAEAVSAAIPSPGASGSRKVDQYLGMIVQSEEELAEAFERVGQRHAKEPD